MSNEPRRRRRRQTMRGDLQRLLLIGALAAVLIGAARAVVAQDAPTEAPAAPPPEAPAPSAPPAGPATGGGRPSVDVSADAAVDFPGDI